MWQYITGVLRVYCRLTLARNYALTLYALPLSNRALFHVATINLHLIWKSIDLYKACTGGLEGSLQKKYRPYFNTLQENVNFKCGAIVAAKKETHKWFS